MLAIIIIVSVLIIASVLIIVSVIVTCKIILIVVARVRFIHLPKGPSTHESHNLTIRLTSVPYATYLVVLGEYVEHAAAKEGVRASEVQVQVV